MKIFGVIFTFLVFFEPIASEISSDQILFFVTDDIEDRNDPTLGTLVDRQNAAQRHGHVDVDMIAAPIYNQGQGQAFGRVQANSHFSRGLQWLTRLLNLNEIHAAEDATWPLAGRNAIITDFNYKCFIIGRFGNRNGQIPLDVVRNAFRNWRNINDIDIDMINVGDEVCVQWNYTVNPRDSKVPTHFTFNVILF